jgi:exocyst complex component 3
MLDFQAAERQRLEEPASDVGLECLCALVRLFFFITMYILSPHDSPLLPFVSYHVVLVLFEQINNNLRCYELSSELSSSTLESLPENYAEQVQMSH